MKNEASVIDGRCHSALSGDIQRPHSWGAGPQCTATVARSKEEIFLSFSGSIGLRSSPTPVAPTAPAPGSSGQRRCVGEGLGSQYPALSERAASFFGGPVSPHHPRSASAGLGPLSAHQDLGKLSGADGETHLGTGSLHWTSESDSAGDKRRPGARTPG